jgi:leader peptidase (prepilin peptidase)/N-methyltransferase
VVGDQSPLLIAFAALLGLLWGSFASVVAYRIPRREPIASGRSRCPACGHVIAALDNIPVVAYVARRARCRHCGARIAARYPLIEIATAVLFALSAWRFGASATAVVYAAFFWVLIVLSVIDIDHHLLPNRIVYPTLGAGWLSLAVMTVANGDGSRLVDALLGAVIFGGFILAIAFAYPAGMGGGDVKLAFLLGTFVGYVGAPGVVLIGMFLSFLLGSVIGLVAMKLTGGDRRMQVPFGPSLALGSVIAILVGRPLLDAYLRL